MLHMCSAEPIAGLQATVLKCTASVIFGVGGMADLSLPCQDTVAFVGAWGLRPYCRRVGRRSAELCRAAVRLFAGLVSGAQITQRMTKQAASSVGRRPGGGASVRVLSHTYACGQGTGHQPVSTCVRNQQPPFGCDRYLAYAGLPW
jgi:hypothetical protein